MSMSTRCQDRCLGEEKLASLQQAPGRLHVETRAGRVSNLSLPISQAVEIFPRCADMVTRLPPPFFSSVSPVPGCFSAGQPSLHSFHACMVYWNKGALRRNCRQKYGETSFSPSRVFLFSRNPSVRFWGLIIWHLWIGRAKHPGPALPLSQVGGLEVFNVGEGAEVAHGHLALDAQVDFLAVVEHRLIPARVRSEWARLKEKGPCW